MGFYIGTLLVVAASTPRGRVKKTLSKKPTNTPHQVNWKMCGQISTITMATTVFPINIAQNHHGGISLYAFMSSVWMLGLYSPTARHSNKYHGFEIWTLLENSSSPVSVISTPINRSNKNYYNLRWLNSCHEVSLKLRWWVGLLF